MAIEGIYLARPAGYPAPFLQAVVELPRLGLRNEVDFLVDTGADNTVLNPFDILNLNLDRTGLRPPTPQAAASAGNSIITPSPQTFYSSTARPSSPGAARTYGSAPSSPEPPRNTSVNCTSALKPNFRRH